jgi:diguanylate cyclase (GGDEF)-like protein
MGTPEASFELHAKRVLAFLQERLPFAIWMVTRAAGKDQIVLQADGEAFGMKPGDRFRWSDTFCSRMVDGEGPRVAPKADDIPAYAGTAFARELGIKAYVGVPIPDEDGLFGTLCAVDPAPQPADIAEQEPLVTIFAELLGAVMAAERALDAERRRTERAERSSRTDALTGVGNRRLWDEVVSSEDARCARYGDPAGVIVLDLDGLKTHNDTQGHAAGDELIRRTAEVLSNGVRVHDFVARLGGDEFGVLAIRTDGDGLETLRQRLAAQLQEAGISACVGAAARSPEVSLVQAVEAADAEMYEAKRARVRGQTTAATI